jgi:hypothetical protein
MSRRFFNFEWGFYQRNSIFLRRYIQVFGEKQSPASVHGASRTLRVHCQDGDNTSEIFNTIKRLSNFLDLILLDFRIKLLFTVIPVCVWTKHTLPGASVDSTILFAQNFSQAILFI